MNLLNKIAVSISTVALVATVFIAPSTALGATAGGVYSTPDGTVWFVTKDMQKRPFTSAGAFLSYGFLNFSQVQPADASVTALPTGSFIAPADGKIFCATETKGSDVAGECALITGSQKASFTSAAVFAAQGHSFERAMYGDSSFLSKTSNIDNGSAAHLPGVLVNNGGTVQMVVSGGLWGIPSIEVFNSWGYSFADVVPANSADTAKSQVGVIPARMAGELTPTGTTGPSNPGTGPTDCSNDGSEGSVDTYALGSAEDTEALEGESMVEIYAVEVELGDDGDLCLDRVDVWFSQVTGGDSDDPWDYFTEVHLMVNGEEVASMDADSESDWSDVSTGNISVANTDNEYRMRFSGLSAGLESDETAVVSVGVSMVNNLDSQDESAVWWVEIDDDSGFRYTDGTGFIFTEGGGATALEDSFTVGGADEAVIEVSLAPESPDSSVVEISATADTNDVHIATYTVEETQGIDVNIEEIQVDIAITDPAGGVNLTGAGQVARRAKLVVDGDVVATETVSATALSEVVTFDGLDIDLDGDSELDFEVHVDIEDTNNAARFDEGTRVNADDFDVTEFRDENGNDESDITVTEGAIAEIHELRTQGIMVEFVSSSAVKTFTAESAGQDDQGTYEIVFDVTAFGGNMYVDRESADETAGDDAGEGVIFDINSTAGVPALSSNLLEAAGTESGDTANVFQVLDDETRRFTLTVVLTADTTPTDGSHQVYIESINWDNEAGDTTPDFFYTFNLGDFKTPYLFLNAN